MDEKALAAIKKAHFVHLLQYDTDQNRWVDVFRWSGDPSNKTIRDLEMYHEVVARYEDAKFVVNDSPLGKIFLSVL